jgi:hypothetical protein
MNLMRRLVTLGALFCSVASTSVVQAQVVERPVPFDSAGRVFVITPFIAERAALQAPWWPVSGDFNQARLYTVNDSSYILTVARRSGVVERYTLRTPDRDAIRAIVSRLPREVVEPRNDARNAFVRNQTLLGILFYGPAFAGAFADNTAGATAGYFVVAGGTFFAASEISRRMFVTRAQSDLSTNMGHNIWLAGWATMYLFGAGDRAQAAGAFLGGLGGATLGLRLARHMSEADAIGSGFGSNISALIAWGALEALKGESGCTYRTDGTLDCRSPRISDKAEVATILASGLIGYPLGLLYPRNATYNVTPGDIQTLYATTGLGILAGVSFLPESPKQSTAFAVGTAGGVLGMIAGDRFLVQRYDHGRGEGSRITLGTLAGGLMGAGVAALIDTDLNNPQLVFGAATVGGLIGLIVSERYVDAASDAGRRGARLSFNPASIFLTAARTPGNHSLINVRF